MKPILAALLALASAAWAIEPIDQPPHNYWTRPIHDRFTRLQEELQANRVQLSAGGELEFLRAILKALEVPESSQMLVFSTTSLQLRLITPRNPRALYFNEDTYVGFIPGGRVEVISLDPELGAIFHIMDIPRAGEPVRAERSDRCMNCHAKEETQGVPGLNIRSVVPGPRGGSLRSYRQGQTGHAIPFSERFGGWYVTGAKAFGEQHWGNVVGQLSPAGMKKFPIEVTTMADTSRYLRATSDVLPQLLHEHQAGFVNRLFEAIYRTRELSATSSGGALTTEQSRELDEKAKGLARYILFADEVPLPAGGVEGDAAFRADFLRQRRLASDGTSLRDFDLKTRLFRLRCSYMIYSSAFKTAPAPLKQRVFAALGTALNVAKPDPDYAWMPAAEKAQIHKVLRETLPGLPSDW